MVSSRLSLDAYESAKLLCEQYYLGAPELELRQMNGETSHTKHTLAVFFSNVANVCVHRALTILYFFPPLANNNKEPIHISYIPSHLYHMLFELFKVCASANKQTNICHITCHISYYISHTIFSSIWGLCLCLGSKYCTINWSHINSLSKSVQKYGQKQWVQYGF